jgi:hypothetical protein
MSIHIEEQHSIRSESWASRWTKAWKRQKRAQSQDMILEHEKCIAFIRRTIRVSNVSVSSLLLAVYWIDQMRISHHSESASPSVNNVGLPKQRRAGSYSSQSSPISPGQAQRNIRLRDDKSPLTSPTLLKRQSLRSQDLSVQEMSPGNPLPKESLPGPTIPLFGCTCTYSDIKWTPSSLLVGSLIVAEKALWDQIWRSTDWALFTRIFTTKKINQFEAQFLYLRGWSVSPPTTSEFRNWLLRLQVHLVIQKLQSGFTLTYFDVGVLWRTWRAKNPLIGIVLLCLFTSFCIILTIWIAFGGFLTFPKT